MKTGKLIMISLVSAIIVSCAGMAQKNSGSPLIFKQPMSVLDTARKPTTNYRINKEYDSKGNLVRYDSVYSYVYTGSGKPFLNDSIFYQLKPFLGTPFPAPFNGFNSRLFFNDSLFKQSILEDGFRKQQERDRVLFDGIRKQLDSLQHYYLQGPSPKKAPKKI
jgi:hypothetical protein